MKLAICVELLCVVSVYKMVHRFVYGTVFYTLAINSVRLAYLSVRADGK